MGDSRRVYGTSRPESVLVCRSWCARPIPGCSIIWLLTIPASQALLLRSAKSSWKKRPTAIESLVNGYAVAIGFSFTGKPMRDGFCHVVTYKNCVNLGFNRGALLADAEGILEGSGKLIRHLRINDHDDLDRPLVRRFLRAAIQQVGQVGASSQRLPAKTTRSAAKRVSHPK